MSVEVKIPKKLIEVALPLDEINKASTKEKSIRHGHPSTMHIWWARRPLATARAVLFAQTVNDPGYERNLGRGVNKEEAQKRRERLFRIIEKLVKWENTNNEEVLAEARAEILNSWRETCELNKDHPQARELFDPNCLPAFHDPFAGGGAIPLEAQRLGFTSHASDLNPIAVTINKAMIEIPPKFCGRKPVGPQNGSQPSLLTDYSGASGLAEDVRRYGSWLREEAAKRVGQLYPTLEITPEIGKKNPRLKHLVGQKLTPIAWLWARTVKSPSPAYSHVDVPLVSSWDLSVKDGKATWIAADVNAKKGEYSFRVVVEGPENTLSTVNRKGATCILSKSPIPFSYIREEGKAGRMGKRLLAVVAEGERGRIYLDPLPEFLPPEPDNVATWFPELEINHHPRDIKTQTYGLLRYGDLFTSRQLASLTTFCDLLGEVVSKCRQDALASGMPESVSLSEGGTGALAYAEAVAIYLMFAIDKVADRGSTICSWDSSRESLRNTFGRQALPMTWDFAETNLFSESAGSFLNAIDQITRVMDDALPSTPNGHAERLDAQDQDLSRHKIISTDPPYYDNIGYADLSDYFYVWMRRGLSSFLPRLFGTPAVPKAEELVATPYRHGTKEKAEEFFLEGMTRAMQALANFGHPAFPVTIYYAFKQSETKDEQGTASTGWETFLEAVLKAGFAITGTWPMRTELGNRMIGTSANALASSIVLVCRKRSPSAATVGRRDFQRELNAALPDALEAMTKGSGDLHAPVAPVDLSQAIIGPGMAIFSKYAAVLEADGKPMSVRSALQLINRFLADEDFDHDTQFCMHWFEGHGWDKGPFGEADVLARAKGTSVEGLKEGGTVESAGGTLRLLKPTDLPPGWSPEDDSRTSAWEVLHHLIRALNSGGETSAGEILAKSSRFSEAARTLAYRQYTVCERKNWTQDAGQYNSLVLAWESIEKAAQAVGYTGTQTSFFGDSTPAAVIGNKGSKARKKK